MVEAAGLVVAPGFIDILSYEPNPYGIWFKIADGVTTNLGLHGLRARAADFFSAYASDALRPPTHYGGAFSNPFARESLGLGVDDPATTEQIDAMVAQCDEDLRGGYIAVDFEPEYTPGVEYAEIKALAEVAKDHDVPATFHARFSDDVAPGTNAEALDEVLRVARDTGVRVHIEHIISTGGTYTMRAVARHPREGATTGLEVTACTYPYDYWATYLASTRFNDGWQERFHITYGDLAIVGYGRATHGVDVRDLSGAERALRRVRDPGERRARHARAPTGSCSAATRSSSPATRTIHARPAASPRHRSLHARAARSSH